MPQIRQRQLSPGEIANKKRLAELEAVRRSKLRPGYSPNANTIYKPSLGSYGELLNITNKIYCNIDISSVML